VPEDSLAIAVEVLGKADAWAGLAQQAGQRRATDFPRTRAQILAVEREQVEGEQGTVASVTTCALIW
jgi:hypothetical protein